MRNILVVGLTGGISSGKSTVSAMCREAGIPVICADELAHDCVKPGKPALKEIHRIFGDEVIGTLGELDRAALAELVFHDPSRRKILESIIHPRVSEATNNTIKELENQGRPVVVVDVPLLYEAAWENAFDLVIVVYTSPEVQKQRLALRDNISIEEISSRLDAQIPIEEKRKRADIVLDNNGTLDDTRLQVAIILHKLNQQADLKKKERNVDVSERVEK